MSDGIDELMNELQLQEVSRKIPEACFEEIQEEMF